MSKPLRILVIHLEFPKWRIGRSWSYQAQLGFTEGFAGNNVEPLTLLNLYGGCPPNRNWQDAARKIIGGRKFDQVWMEAVHCNYDEDFLSFIAELAPVRVAMLCESMQYDEETLAQAPVLRKRYAEVKKKLRFFTHVLACDEADVSLIESDCGLRALWLVLGMPQWCIANRITEPLYDRAIFSGPVYGARGKFLQDAELSQYMLHLPSIENRTLYPRRFDLLQKMAALSLQFCAPLALRRHARYLDAVREVRKKLHRCWIDGLKRGVAVVQLPHFVSTFPGRVYEGMAAGRPVITVPIVDRPKTMRLFEPGKEILYYHDSQELIELIKRMRQDKRAAREISENAVKKLRAFYPSELRVKQILKWIESGEQPDYQGRW